MLGSKSDKEINKFSFFILGFLSPVIPVSPLITGFHMFQSVNTQEEVPYMP
jgi:hypothetical protein